MFTYIDSIAGIQHEKFNSVKELIDHIESFKYIEESDGIIYKNNIPFVMYVSRENVISLIKYDN